MYKKIALIITIAASLILVACQQNNESNESVAHQQKPQEQPVPLGQLGHDVVPQHYALDLTIVPGKETFQGQVTIDIVLKKPHQRIYLHGINIDVGNAWVQSDSRRVQAEYQQLDRTGVAQLELESVIPAGQASINIQYQAPFNQSLEGLYQVTEAGDHYAFTQFEATSARLAFPGFDEPAFKTPFDIAVTAQSNHVVITSTAEISRQDVGNGLVKRQYQTTPPLPTYMLAFAVGPLDVVEWDALPPTQVREFALPLRGVAAKGKGGKLKYALENTRGIVESLEEYFAVPFPYPKLDIIAVPDFAAGAMENVGAITYREQLLLIEDNPSLRQLRAYARVHSHELAHQWFGNLVTPRWWDDIWLNESFATWMGNKGVDRWQPDQGYGNLTLRGALGVMDADSLVTARQIRQPIKSNHDIATAFDGITYRKGGGVLQMFESYLGEEAFREGVRLHMKRFAHGVADVNDFMQSLADGSGRDDVVASFESFLYQPGLPFIRAELSCDSEQVKVNLAQSRYFPLGSEGSRDQTWKIPVCMAYQNDNGIQKHCEMLTEQSDQLVLPTDQCPLWFMPNANGSGYYRWTLDENSWSNLFENLTALNEREAQSMLNSLAAGFNADEVSTQTMASAVEILARSESREVATGPANTLKMIHKRLATDADAKAGLEAYIRSAYGPRLAEIGLSGDSKRDKDNPTETTLLRTDLVNLLALTGNDQALRDQLVNQAITYLGLGQDNTSDQNAINPNLIPSALTVAIDQGNKAFANNLLGQALASRDAIFRQRALRALASSAEPEIGVMMRELILDQRLRDNEATLIAFTQTEVAEQQEQIWRWVQENLDELVARIPTWNQGRVTFSAGEFCTIQKAEETESFFGERVIELEGGPRQLQQTIERIKLCAALVEAKADEVNEYFGAP